MVDPGISDVLACNDHMIGGTVVQSYLHVRVLSHVLLSGTPCTVARQVPLSVEFSRPGYWSGLPFPPPGDLPDPGIGLLHWQADSLPPHHLGSPQPRLQARRTRPCWTHRGLSCLRALLVSALTFVDSVIVCWLWLLYTHGERKPIWGIFPSTKA